MDEQNIPVSDYPDWIKEEREEMDKSNFGNYHNMAEDGIKKDPIYQEPEYWN